VAVCCLCSAVLAHYLLQEKLNVFGVLGCVLCIVGSIVIVLHAPVERQVSSVMEIWAYAMRPGACTASLTCASFSCGQAHLRPSDVKLSCWLLQMHKLTRQ
jgi:magnesium transporter